MSKFFGGRSDSESSSESEASSDEEVSLSRRGKIELDRKDVANSQIKMFNLKF